MFQCEENRRGVDHGKPVRRIGGFPLAAVRNGIIPVWASEIEAFPIEVTKLRFPEMVHVGDITQLDGAKLPPVHIICGGSPCQDLSVAGARAGLAGERSGLFMEQIRITKEMRDAEDKSVSVSDLARFLSYDPSFVPYPKGAAQLSDPQKFTADAFLKLDAKKVQGGQSCHPCRSTRPTMSLSFRF